MSEWTKTPFSSLKQAHDWAARQGMATDIEQDERGISYFRTSSLMVAQRGPDEPVYQKPYVLRYKPEKRKVAGPWTRSRHKDFQEVRSFYMLNVRERNYSIEEPVLLVTYKGTEYEYVVRNGRLYSRSLHAPSS